MIVGIWFRVPLGRSLMIHFSRIVDATLRKIRSNISTTMRIMPDLLLLESRATCELSHSDAEAYNNARNPGISLTILYVDGAVRRLLFQYPMKAAQVSLPQGRPELAVTSCDFFCKSYLTENNTYCTHSCRCNLDEARSAKAIVKRR